MERSSSIKPVLWRLFILAFVLIVFSTSKDVSAAETRKLVLVTHTKSKISPLTKLALRHLYLGAPIKQRGVRIISVRNMSDPLLYEVFLQKVMHMSASNYERLMISRIYQRGGQRLITVSKTADLVPILQRNLNTLSFMWEETALSTPNIKIVNILWEGKIK